MENRDNFIRWRGSLQSSPYANIAAPVSATMLTNAAYVDVVLLSGAVSTFGIDPDSVAVVAQDPSDMRVASWNSTTGILRVFRPGSMPVSQAAVVTYAFSDRLGNVSNTANVTVDLSLSSLAWRVAPASAYCLTNAFGIKTGLQGWTTLELYYPTTGNPLYSPYTTKPNQIGDLDYVAPVTNLTACPLPSVATVTIVNNTAPGANSVTITSLTWKKAPLPNVVQTVNVTPGAQTTLNLPTGIYDELDIAHSHTGSINGLGMVSKFYAGGVLSVTTAVNNTSTPIVILNPTHAQPGTIVQFN